jgi:Zn ribbon nucleic-acid-binding protein
LETAYRNFQHPTYGKGEDMKKTKDGFIKQYTMCCGSCRAKDVILFPPELGLSTVICKKCGKVTPTVTKEEWEEMLQFKVADNVVNKKRPKRRIK